MKSNLKESFNAIASEQSKDGNVARFLKSNGAEDSVVALAESLANGSIGLKDIKKFDAELRENSQFKEAVQSSTVPSLLRLGVEGMVALGFKMFPTVWQDCVMQINTNSRFQPYGFISEAEEAEEIAEGTSYPQTDFVPFDRVFENKKFGKKVSITREAYEDDQTGELRMGAEKAGTALARTRERMFAGYLHGDGITNGTTVVVPPYTDPADALVGVYQTTGDRANAIADAPVSEASVVALRQLASNILGANKENLVVVPDAIIVASVQDENQAKKLMSSTTYAEFTAGTATLSDSNPLKGWMNVKYCHLQKANSWFMMQTKSRSLIYQSRGSMRVIAENSEAGESWERDLMQWKVDERFNFGILNSRYLFRGKA